MPQKHKKRNDVVSKKQKNKKYDFESIEKEINRKNQKQAKKLICKTDFDFNFIIKNNERLIHRVCYLRQPLVLEALLIKKVDINHQNFDGRTPVMLIFFNNDAIITNDVIKCFYLLNGRPDLDFIKKDKNGNSLVNYAFEFYEKLSKEDKVVFSVCLMEIKIKIKQQISKAIERKELNVDEYIGYGLKPIHLACFDADDEMIRFLLDEKCDVNAQSWEGWITPLMFMFSRDVRNIDVENSIKCARLLIDVDGVDLVKRDLRNKSLIEYMECFFNELKADEKNRLDDFFDEVKSRAESQIVSEGADGEFFVLIYELIIKNEEDKACGYIANRAELKKYFKNDDGWTLIHLACYFNKPKLIRALINRGCDVNCESLDGLTPLFALFVKEKNCDFSDFLESVRNFLVSPDVDLLKINKTGESIKNYLLMCGSGGFSINLRKEDVANVDLIIKLITLRIVEQVVGKIKNEGYPVDGLNVTGEPVLYWACYYNDAENIEFLLEKGADVNHQNHAGETLLMRIFSCNNLLNMDFLDAASVLINHSKANLLLFEKNGYRLVDFFYIYEKNLTVQSNEKIEIINKLIYRNTARQVFEKIKQDDDLCLNLKFLITEEASFHLACYMNDYEIIKVLLEKGVDINCRTKYGCTPLDILLSNSLEHLSILKCLRLVIFSQKIEFFKKDDGESYGISRLLDYGKKFKDTISKDERAEFKKICKEAEKQVISEINKFKVDKKFKDHDLVHLACMHNKPQILKALVRKKVDVNCINDRGQTPLMILFCTHHGNFSILKSAEVLLNSKKIDLWRQDQGGKTVHIYFDEYVKSLPKREAEPVLVQDECLENLKNEDVDDKKRFMSKSQSTCHVNLFFLAGNIKKPFSILNKESRVTADKMLEELKFHCSARSKRVSLDSHLDKSVVKEKRQKGLFRSQSSASLFSNSKKPIDPISIWFDQALSRQMEPECLKKIKDKNAHGHNRAYFDLTSLRRQMSDDDFYTLEKKIKEGLNFSEEADKGIKNIDGAFYATVDGVRCRLRKEIGIGDISRVFFFKVRSTFRPETLWVATVYDPYGLHGTGNIKSFKKRLGVNKFDLNLPEIDGKQLGFN